MRRRYPLGPLIVPALIGMATAFALLAALLDDGWLEVLSVGLLGAIVLLVGACLIRRRVRP